jgi:hypothetical protein
MTHIPDETEIAADAAPPLPFNGGLTMVMAVERSNHSHDADDVGISLGHLLGDIYGARRFYDHCDCAQGS